MNSFQIIILTQYLNLLIITVFITSSLHYCVNY